MTGEPTHTTSKGIVSHAPVINYGLKMQYPLRFVVCPLHSITNQELFEMCLCNQNSHHEKYGQFPLYKPREAITRYRQSIHQCASLSMKCREKYISAIKIATMDIWTISVTNLESVVHNF